MASSTYTVNQAESPTAAGKNTPIVLQPYSPTGRKLGVSDLEETREASIPHDAVEVKQQWNSPGGTKWRVFSTFWSFFLVGANDGSLGALIPHLEPYYNLNYTIVSLIFLAPFAGYSIASIFNNMVHVRFGQRGVAVVAPLCHVVSYVVVALHPPYPVVVVMFIFVGFGNGLVDAAWCAWLGNMANANEVQGFLQASYSLGATVSPLIATALIQKTTLGWYGFYYLMIAAASVEFLTCATTFWKQTGAMYEAENPRDPSSKTGRTRQAMKSRITWLFCFFVFAYVGAEVSLGGWIITFMSKVRGAVPFAASATSTAYWGGMTVGRLFLPYLTARLGEYPSVILYLGLSFGLELIFWLVPNLIVSAVAVSLLGVFMGPMFPTAIVLVTKLLPRDLHVGCIGFGTAFGGSGGAIFPFMVGAIAQSKGVKTLQPVILALLVVMSGLWIGLKTGKGKKKSGEESESTEAVRSEL
ncbi:related to tetracycline resistance proteins [Rhynchosporium secalis]|uniref:Related to tetracycline resistance proteins n=1 Tax=Rhynchosporium secalis TaxID=38038 RepID=A0A1E1MRF0_RHYSE|nr:related to tetracycline resistance proteins [Rhynchosporium secalis]